MAKRIVLIIEDCPADYGKVGRPRQLEYHLRLAKSVFNDKIELSVKKVVDLITNKKVVDDLPPHDVILEAEQLAQWANKSQVVFEGKVVAAV